MSINNLRNYNWEQGTQASPVLLTGAEFNKLTALIEESNRVGSNISTDIRGWVQVGQNITSYQKYLAELAKDGQGNPLLHVVNTQVDPVSYTVTPQSNSIKEGTSTKLNINGIGLEALKFRIVNHTNTTPDYQARTTIDTELGYVRVAPAQENTTWADVITIQACPVWEEWTDENASIVEFYVTVNAVAVTSVTITAPQYVKPGVTFNPIVNFLPVGHSKPIVNTLEDAAAKRGICFIPTSDDFSVGKTTDPTKMFAIAPNTETPVGETWSLGCGVYAFTNTQTIATPSINVAVKYPYIQFTITTDGDPDDIVTANPKIALQKVDSQDEPIGEPVVLTGEPIPDVNPTSLVYTHGNGNVAGDGSETYQVTFGVAPEGYSNIQQMTITPNQVITEIAVQYVVKRPGIYQVYGDGYEPISAVQERGGFISGKTRIGIAIVTDETKFIIGIGDNLSKHGRLISSTSPCPAEGRTAVGSVLDASEDYDGERNTIAIANYFTEHSDLIDGEGAIPPVREKTVTYGGQVFNGYIPALGQALLIVANVTALDSFIKTYYQRSGYLPTGVNRLHSSTGSTELIKYWNPNSSGSSAESQVANQKWVTCFEFDDTIISLIV